MNISDGPNSKYFGDTFIPKNELSGAQIDTMLATAKEQAEKAAREAAQAFIEVKDAARLKEYKHTFDLHR